MNKGCRRATLRRQEEDDDDNDDKVLEAVAAVPEEGGEGMAGGLRHQTRPALAVLVSKPAHRAAQASSGRGTTRTPMLLQVPISDLQIDSSGTAG